MNTVDLIGGDVRLAGILHTERTDTGYVLERLPGWTRHQIVDPALRMLRSMASGARLEFVTDASVIELDVMLTMVKLNDVPTIPAPFDLVVDGELVAGVRATEGTVLKLDTRTGGFEFIVGDPTMNCFADLAPGEKHVEIWLPHGSVAELRALRTDGRVTAPPPSARPRWVHYGSSISHCLEAERPTGVWPVVAARLANVDLQSLAIAGQCQLDQFIARTIRDLPVDFVSLKLGINVVNHDSMRERVFVPAVHGFLDTIRDGHPDVPIAIITPITCPVAENHPGPTGSDENDQCSVTPRSAALSIGALTLSRIRELHAEVIAARQAEGDKNLHLIDGPALFGPDDVADLPDGLHPNAAGYQRMGERFHALAFGAGGPFVG